MQSEYMVLKGYKYLPFEILRQETITHMVSKQVTKEIES